MSRIIFSVISLLLFSNIWAASSVTLNWVIPTQREDNTPMGVSEIASYEIEVASGSCTNPFTRIATVAPGTTATFVLQSVSVGIKCYRISTVDTGGQRSVPSNTSEIKILAPPKAGVLSVVIKVAA
jgi:hypothetical protein